MRRTPLKRRASLRARRKPAEADPAFDVPSVINACLDCGGVISWNASRCKRCAAVMNGQKATAARRAMRTEYEHTCAACGTAFKSEKPVRKFCSQACMGEAAKKPRVCVVCGKEFWARWYYTKTCSRKCLSKRRVETNRTYRNVPHPTGNTSDIWYASKGTNCEVCGSTQALHLHHVVRVQDIQREHGDVNDPANGMTLCQGCHFAHHRPGANDTRIDLSMVPLRAKAWCLEMFGEERGWDYLHRMYRSDA